MLTHRMEGRDVQISDLAVLLFRLQYAGWGKGVEYKSRGYLPLTADPQGTRRNPESGKAQRNLEFLLCGEASADYLTKRRLWHAGSTNHVLNTREKRRKFSCMGLKFRPD